MLLIDIASRFEKEAKNIEKYSVSKQILRDLQSLQMILDGIQENRHAQAAASVDMQDGDRWQYPPT